MDKETERLLRERLDNDKKKERNLKIIVAIAIVVFAVIPIL